MFSFFSQAQPSNIKSRFSTFVRLKPLFDLVEALRIQVDKLHVSMTKYDDNDSKTAHLKYDVLKPYLDNIDDYINVFNNVPQEAQNDLQDIKCLLDAINHATNKIDVVKRNFLSLERGVTNYEIKSAGFSVASIATVGAYIVGAISGPFAFVAGALLLDAGVRANAQDNTNTRSIGILLNIEDTISRILHEVNRELELYINYSII